MSSKHPYCSVTISLSLSYLLIILLCTPFVTSASASRLRLTQANSPARYREGEILVRFREGVSQKDKDTIIATQGARRNKQLRGDSGLEKLELTAGRDIKTAALQFLLNPQVQFAEPNFLISREDITPNGSPSNLLWRRTLYLMLLMAREMR